MVDPAGGQDRVALGKLRPSIDRHLLSPIPLIRKILPDAWLRQIRIWRVGRFTVLQLETDGLLPVAAYQALYETFRAGPDLDVVEIGGASGAATIAIALALRERRAKAKIVVVEKFEGGTRTPYGGHAENLARFWRFLRLYRVDSYVRLWDGYLTDDDASQVRRLVETPRLAGLLLDADGRIHRDLRAFWDLIGPETEVFIDDVHPSLSVKHELTFRLVTRLVEQGWLEIRRRIENTVVARRCSSAGPDFPWQECQDIYLAFCREKGVRFGPEGITPSAA
jgi:hypothetical protein